MREHVWPTRSVEKPRHSGPAHAGFAFERLSTYRQHMGAAEPGSGLPSPGAPLHGDEGRMTEELGRRVGMKVFGCVAGLVLLVGVLSLSQLTLVVPDDYPTIQAAIDAAGRGDRILVRVGRYQENVSIHKPLHLCGEEAALTIIESPDPASDVITVELTASLGETVIESLTIRHGHTGILIHSNWPVQVSACIIALNSTGILVRGGNVSVAGCYLWQNSRGGIVLWPNVPWPNDRFSLKGNEIEFSQAGIVLRIAGELVMSENTIGRVGRALDVVAPKCGWAAEPEGGLLLRTLAVRGEGNRMHGVDSPICPPDGSAPWPPGFVVTGFQEAVDSAVELLRSAGHAGSDDPSRGLSDVETAISILEEARYPPLLADVYTLKGALHMAASAPEDAIRAFLMALAIVRERGMQAEIALVSEVLGDLYLGREGYTEAYECFSEAAGAYLLLENQQKAGAATMNAGIALANQGMFEQALTLLEKALQVYESYPPVPDDLGRLLVNLGNVLDELERHVEALEILQRAELIFSECRDWEGWVACAMGTGGIYARIGRYEEAIAWFERGRLVAYEHGLSDQWAKCTVNAGTACMEVGDIGKAVGYYREAYDGFVGPADSEFRATLLMNLGVALYETGELSEAYACLSQARELFAQLPTELATAQVCGNLGNLLSRMGRFEEARTQYEIAEEIFGRQEMWTSQALTHMNIGVLLDRQGQHQEALDRYRDALTSLARVEVQPECSTCSVRWSIYYNQADCLETIGRWDEAIDAYLLSVRDAEGVRGWLTREELKLAWGKHTQRVYERLIDLLYRMGQGASAFPYVERCRARTFLDLLAMGPVGTLENVAEAGIKTGVVEPKVIEADLEEVISTLPPDTVALEYFVTENATYLWVISNGEVQGPVQIPHGRVELMNKVIECRKRLEEGKEVVNRDLAELYEWLVRPAADLLPETTGGEDAPHLVIIPSGPLYYLPFQALIWTSEDRSENAPLIARYPLSYSPSLATLKYAQAMGETAYPQATFLGFADPDSGDPFVVRLPEAQTEAKRIAALFPVATVYVDKEATEEAVQSHSATAREVLLSTHGSFNPHNPMFSYLLLAPTEKSDGRLCAYEVFSLPLHADLVTLSACETLLPSLEEMEKQVKAVRGEAEDEPVTLTDEQLEQLTSGDEIVGLTRAFIFAGSASVLSSLWSVPSESTAELMVSFYRHLEEGMGKAQALRAAQLEVMKTTGCTHPWYWAAFNLMGDWR